MKFKNTIKQLLSALFIRVLCYAAFCLWMWRVSSVNIIVTAIIGIVVIELAWGAYPAFKQRQKKAYHGKYKKEREKKNKLQFNLTPRVQRLALASAIFLSFSLIVMLVSAILHNVPIMLTGMGLALIGIGCMIVALIVYLSKQAVWVEVVEIHANAEYI